MPFHFFAISRKMSLCFDCGGIVAFTSLNLRVNGGRKGYTLRLKHA